MLATILQFVIWFSSLLHTCDYMDGFIPSFLQKCVYVCIRHQVQCVYHNESCYCFHHSNGSIVFVSSVGGFVPFSVSVCCVCVIACLWCVLLYVLDDMYMLCTCYFTGTWSLFSQQDCLVWIDQSSISRTRGWKY